MNNRVILCEPQCWGFEHAHLNAALLDTVLWAFPEAVVTFAGEREHVEAVRKTITRYDPPAEQRTTWKAIPIPARRLWGYPRLGAEWYQSGSILQFAAEQGAEALIWCSITNSGLLALKARLYCRRQRFPILAIPHCILGSIVNPPARRPWLWPLGLRQILRLPHPRNLRCIALSEPIHRCVRQVLPRAAGHFAVLETPYFWAEQTNQPPPQVPERISFGHLGVANSSKGFDSFLRLAATVTRQTNMSRFVLAGSVSTPGDYPHAGDDIEGIGSELLTPDEYVRRASSITYAVNLSDPAHYRLVASGSFLDALSFVKPVIQLRNPNVDYYFKKIGDIGYLCDNLDEVQATVLSLAREMPIARYRQQCENILRGRQMFEPKTLARNLRATIHEISAGCGFC